MSLKEYEKYLFHGDENLKFAEILKMLRKEKKISLRKLEELTGINDRHISEMENAKCFIGKKTQKSLQGLLMPIIDTFCKTVKN
jgi:transcriptional regulator with XRE-family HTH domain